MSLFKKLFNLSSKQEKEVVKKQPVKLSLDDSFVHNFINKGGKFLYCTSTDEVKKNLKNIFTENNWNQVCLLDETLTSLLSNVNVSLSKDSAKDTIVFTTCEHLIADNGHILFSSNQLRSKKLSDYSDDFIVYAKTSQLVKNTGEALTGIKTNCKDNLPTNISAIKNYKQQEQQLEESFLEYGNTNSKRLYLLLFEDF